MELYGRVKASMQAHRKTSVKALVELFSHERPFSVLRAIIELKRAGWIKVYQKARKLGCGIYTTHYHSNWVRRTTQEMFEQPSFFDNIEMEDMKIK